MTVQIYDASTDETRDVTQEDIDKLQRMGRNYGRLLMVLQKLSQPGLSLEMRDDLLTKIIAAINA